MGPSRWLRPWHDTARVQVGQDRQETGKNAFPSPRSLRIYPRSTHPPLQQFSDDEGEADQPLAPIQPEDLVEVVEGDDDMEQDEAANSNATPGPMSRDVSEPAPLRPQNESVGEISAPPSKAPSPKPHPLSISFQPPTPTPGPEDVDDGLQDALMPPQAGGEDDVELGGDPLDGGDLSMGGDEGMSLDMGGMGPDGEPFEGADLSQLQSADPLLGGPLMDEGIDDPFGVPQS